MSTIVSKVDLPSDSHQVWGMWTEGNGRHSGLESTCLSNLTKTRTYSLLTRLGRKVCPRSHFFNTQSSPPDHTVIPLSSPLSNDVIQGSYMCAEKVCISSSSPSGTWARWPDESETMRASPVDLIFSGDFEPKTHA